MKVIETGDRMCFSVESKTTLGKFYRVDLLQLGGYSWCACKDWEMRRSKAISKGLPMGTKEVTCIHVRAARNHLMNQILRKLARGENQP